MTKEKREKISEALADFIIRVTIDKTASEKDVEVLPETVRALIEFERSY